MVWSNCLLQCCIVKETVGIGTCWLMRGKSYRHTNFGNFGNFFSFGKTHSSIAHGNRFFKLTRNVSSVCKDTAKSLSAESEQLNIEKSGKTCSTEFFCTKLVWTELYGRNWMIRRWRLLLELSKFRLSVLVVLSAMASYAVGPSMSNSVWSLILLTSGTFFCSASANTFNQIQEPIYDAQMNRTRNRVLVRGAVLPHEAALFGFSTAVLGVGLLFFLNNTVALLGLANILLYSFVYTPLKRISIANTWLGSLVGALPPLMGWAACTNGNLTSHPGGICMAIILFAWQFPHFNSLAWNLRKEYARGGYKMMSVLNPNLNALVSLRWSLITFLPCIGLAASNIVDPYFLIDSSIVNGYLSLLAFKFYQNQTEENARSLFFASLIHLPALLLLIMIHHVTLFWMQNDKNDTQKNENLYT